MTPALLCARCRHVLVDEDDQGWYYQIAVTSEEIPGLVFMDRVHQCDGKPHLVIAPENPSPRCEFCDNEGSHPFHAPDYKFSGRHAFKATAERSAFVREG
jgi:hypothetical protein